MTSVKNFDKLKVLGCLKAALFYCMKEQNIPVENIVVRHVKGLKEWISVRLLYRISFPRSERKPFRIIRRMHRRGKTDVLCAFTDGRFAGFAATINGNDKVLLDYLAVRKKYRNRGVGSAVLACLFSACNGKGVFVEIENAFIPCENRDERLRRRNFYIRSGMEPTGAFASVFGVNMELLGHRTQLDFEAYRTFYRDNYSEFAAKHILPAHKEG